MRRVMVDIETLDNAPTAVILSIGAVDFGPEGVSAPFYRAVDIFSSLLAGSTISSDTVAWWSQQSPEAKAAAQPLKGKVPLIAALEDFAGYLQGADEVWAKGPDFDLVILSQAYRSIGRRQPWSYRNTRDCRTIYALAGDVREPKSGTEHSAVDDAEMQARAVLDAYQKLGVAL